jgi:hypothetical protein
MEGFLIYNLFVIWLFLLIFITFIYFNSYDLA